MFKLKYILSFLVVACFIIGCANDTESTREAAPVQQNAATPAPAADPATAAVTPPPKPPEPAQNADGVWHYTCPKGCDGGGGSATPCEKCGTTLAHNAVYHGNPAATPQLTPGTTIATPQAGQTPSVMLGDPSQGGSTLTVPPPTAATKAPEPPQNAAGVWHYTCPSGCAGGGGGATACTGCGTTLVHNTAYHQ